jgi:hypothetical protein
METFNQFCQKQSIKNLSSIIEEERATLLIISLQDAKAVKSKKEGADSLLQFDCRDPGTQKRCHCLFYFDQNVTDSLQCVKKGSILLGNFYVR